MPLEGQRTKHSLRAMTPTDNLTLRSSRRSRRYWVVSPNVKNTNATVGEWAKLSLRARAAFMGWPLDHPTGRKFAGLTTRGIMPGDIILISRRHRGEPQIVGFGVVRGKYLKRIKGTLPDKFGSLRKLSPFEPRRSPPSDIPLIDALPKNKALVQLHPEASEVHRKVCDWMEQQLGNKDREDESKDGAGTKPQGKQQSTTDDTVEVGAPENHQLDYEVQTKSQVIKAKKVEAELLKKYKLWLKRKGRELSAAKYGGLRCDAYEQQTRNLIEAKSSTRREHIRMAVGQLLDYAFQGEKKLGVSNKAILLPKKPDLAFLKWLEPLKIKIIWREGNSFLDNANGQFS